MHSQLCYSPRGTGVSCRSETPVSGSVIPERTAGLEPATSTLARWRADQLRYARMSNFIATQSRSMQAHAPLTARMVKQT